MFQFTNQHGDVVDALTSENVGMIDALPTSDIRLLPHWINAARTAEENDFCYQYDRIAEALNIPTRDQLRDLGLLDSEFQVEGFREVTLTVRVPFSTTYSASRPADVREEFSADELGEVDMYDVRSAIADYAYDIQDDTDITIESVRRN